jgi:hypothetical protein
LHAKGQQTGSHHQEGTLVKDSLRCPAAAFPRGTPTWNPTTHPWGCQAVVKQSWPRGPGKGFEVVLGANAFRPTLTFRRIPAVSRWVPLGSCGDGAAFIARIAARCTPAPARSRRINHSQRLGLTRIASCARALLPSGRPIGGLGPGRALTHAIVTVSSLNTRGPLRRWPGQARPDAARRGRR